MIGERVGISEVPVPVDGGVTCGCPDPVFTGEGEIDVIRPGIDQDFKPSEIRDPLGWPTED